MGAFLTLDYKGIVLALFFGALILFFGGAYRLLFLADLLLFLVLSAVVTRLGKTGKESIGKYERVRGWKNVLSNGLVPVLAAMLFWINGMHALVPASAMAIAYIASVSSITSDKFASEVGMLDGQPTMLLTLRKAKKGTSGSMTALGTAASFIGALIIGLSAFAVGGGLRVVLIVAASGFLGNVVDTVFGYFEEQGIGNKHTSNFLGSLGGFLICLAILLL